jgi:GNAT superfamily N-acetyltransferase
MEPCVALLDHDSPLLDTVVGWHWREWSHGYADPDREEWRARLNARTRSDAVPFTLVAHLAEEAVACLSVCDDEADAGFPNRGPWLSGMLVLGRARNLGVGRALVQAAEQHVRSLGRRELWVWTTEAGPFYARCGWEYARRKEQLVGAAVLRREL